MTRTELTEQINKLATETKTLFPEGYKAYDGSLFSDNIQEKANAAIEYVNTEKAANLQRVLSSFSAECDTLKSIAAKRAAKGWKPFKSE